MKALGIIITGLGVTLSSFTFLFYTLEDYTPYDDPIPLWPMFLGVAVALIGLACLKKAP